MKFYHLEVNTIPYIKFELNAIYEDYAATLMIDLLTTRSTTAATYADDTELVAVLFDRSVILRFDVI